MLVDSVLRELKRCESANQMRETKYTRKRWWVDPSRPPWNIPEKGGGRFNVLKKNWFSEGAVECHTSYSLFTEKCPRFPAFIVAYLRAEYSPRQTEAAFDVST